MKALHELAIIVIVLGIIIAVPALAEVSTERQIPVVLEASVGKKTYTSKEPLTLYLTIKNGLKESIRFSTFSLVPNEWNGETMSCSLVDIYRNGKKPGLYLARPQISGPPTISGMSAKTIEPGDALKIQIDCRKWDIRGGWIQGTYEITARVNRIRVDSFTSLSILSEPVKFTIK